MFIQHLHDEVLEQAEV